MKRYKYFPAIDFVKLIAIFWIFLFHAFLQFHDWNIPRPVEMSLFEFFNESGSFVKAFVKSLFSVGYLGNHIFFLVSGALLANSQIKKRLSVKEFYVKRLLRIVPLYWFALLFTFFVCRAIGIYFSFEDLFYHFFFLHGFSEQFMYSISPVFWFLAILMQFYLLFPFLFNLIKRLKGVYLFLFFLCLVLLDIYFKSFFATSIATFSDFLFEFAFGLFLALKMPEVFGKDFKFLKFFSLVLSVFLLVVIILALPLPFARYYSPFIDNVAGISLFFWIIFLYQDFIKRFVKILSGLIFPFFLLHATFLLLLKYFFPEITLWFLIAFGLISSGFASYLFLWLERFFYWVLGGLGKSK